MAADRNDRNHGDRREAERSRAARRDLERLGGEGGLFSAPGLEARARSVRDHFAGRDADQSDFAEKWGTRIGRGLSAVALVALLVWFFGYLGR